MKRMTINPVTRNVVLLALCQLLTMQQYPV